MPIYTTFNSPVGPLLLAATHDGLSHLLFDRGTKPPHDWLQDNGTHGQASRWLTQAGHQLTEYFAGTRRDFDIPLAATGTPFQRSVWQSLRDIDYGTTISYGELARRIGNPRAVRAVGLANGRNPISIIVPCHRVIGANGSLTGYGGGLDRKRTLLALEGIG
jgi:methylated-DNA-[protein]-cysteine S-methyltransferase